MNMKKLDKKIQIVWFVGGMLSFVLPLILVLLPYMVGIDDLDINVYMSIMIPITVVWGIIALIYPFLKYHFYSYYYDDKRIYIHKGVIFRHRIVIPVCQIQDLHLQQGPIMIICKLGSLIISTAGSNHIINGIQISQVETIIKELSEELEKRIEELKDEEI